MRPLLDVRTCTDTRGLTSVSRRPAPNPSDPAPIGGPVAVNAEVIDERWPGRTRAVPARRCSPDTTPGSIGAAARPARQRPAKGLVSTAAASTNPESIVRRPGISLSRGGVRGLAPGGGRGVTLVRPGGSSLFRGVGIPHSSGGRRKLGNKSCNLNRMGCHVAQ